MVDKGWDRGHLIRSTTSGITASVSQSQGQQPLTADVNEVATVTNVLDTVTLPAAVVGRNVTVINNGANRLQIFPASGDDLGAGTDASITLLPLDAFKFTACAANTWYDFFSPHVNQPWAFGSPAGGGAKVFYTGGGYEFAASDDDFTSPPTLGTANAANPAHVFIVLGAQTVDDLTLRVTGTAQSDAGTRSPGATSDIVIPSLTAVDTYMETPEKFTGQVTIEVISGTAKTCNYGFAKYWDNNNTRFTVTGLEATWFGGASDSGANITLIPHTATGWTFNSAATPTPPAAIADMNTDFNTEVNIVSGQEGNWKRDNLSTALNGGNGEGTIVQINTTAANAITYGTFSLRYINH